MVVIRGPVRLTRPDGSPTSPINIRVDTGAGQTQIGTDLVDAMKKQGAWDKFSKNLKKVGDTEKELADGSKATQPKWTGIGFQVDLKDKDGNPRRCDRPFILEEKSRHTILATDQLATMGIWPAPPGAGELVSWVPWPNPPAVPEEKIINKPVREGGESGGKQKVQRTFTPNYARPYRPGKFGDGGDSGPIR